MVNGNLSLIAIHFYTLKYNVFLVTMERSICVAPLVHTTNKFERQMLFHLQFIGEKTVAWKDPTIYLKSENEC